ncbi:MAG: hypothetical protein WDZ88_03880 [Candidatus Paceibacterota bacterium]
MQKKNDQISLERVCHNFNVGDVYGLHELQLEHEQKAIKEGFFDENNDSLLINQIKNALLEVDIDKLDKHERKAVQNILWMWHHHATTVSIWKKHNLNHARELCKKALQYLYPTHPNKITPMIDMLLHHDIDGAHKWSEVEVGEVEKEYAKHLLDEYKKGVFNENPRTRARIDV